ncbi:MAG: hypothetical protein SPJ39_09180 [Prevotella sp.]|nr:hypothetical protein [Prevotella sp.]
MMILAKLQLNKKQKSINVERGPGIDAFWFLAHGLVFKQWILGYFVLTSGGRRGREAPPSAHGVRRVAKGG